MLKKGGVVSLLTASLSLESDLVKPLLKEGMYRKRVGLLVY